MGWPTRQINLLNFVTYSPIYWVKTISSPKITWNICLAAIDLDTVFWVHQRVSWTNWSAVYKQMVFNSKSRVCGWRRVEALSELDRIFSWLQKSRFVKTLIELFELLKALKFKNQPFDKCIFLSKPPAYESFDTPSSFLAFYTGSLFEILYSRLNTSYSFAGWITQGWIDEVRRFNLILLSILIPCTVQVGLKSKNLYQLIHFRHQLISTYIILIDGELSTHFYLDGDFLVLRFLLE